MLRVAWWIIAVALGAAQAWAHRAYLSSDDAIAYLDIGDAYMRGDWAHALNAYWSPAYSWLLGLAGVAVHPSRAWEFPLVKLVNFVVYLAVLGCFEIFLRTLQARYERRAKGDATTWPLPISDSVWVTLGYAAFIWSSVVWTRVSSDTPDLAVAGLVYLAAAFVLRLDDRPSWIACVGFGVVLGVAYLAKTVMFPVAIVFIGVAFFAAVDRRSAIRVASISSVAFAAVALPFVLAISLRTGRPTIGESGRLNHVWFVSQDVRPFRFWETGGAHGGTPRHPPRVLNEKPDVYEFATPIGGTFPPWHDPAYWYEGVQTRIRPLFQAVITGRNVMFCVEMFVAASILGYLALVGGIGRTAWQSFRELGTMWPVLIPAGAAVGAYLVGTDLAGVKLESQPTTRYIAPFAVLLMAAALSSVRVTDVERARRRLLALTAVVVVGLAGRLSYHFVRDADTLPRARVTQVQIADTLERLGLRPGDAVAISGYYFFPDYHWARLMRVRIVAEIFQPDVFWEQDASRRAEIIRRIAATGARAIVEKPGPDLPLEAAGWRSIGGGYHALFLDRPRPSIDP